MLTRAAGALLTEAALEDNPMNDDPIDHGDAVHLEGTAKPQGDPKPVDLTKLNLETLEVFFPSEDPSSVTIWFDKFTIESLRKIANRQDLPVGWLIRKIMKEFIDREGFFDLR